MSNAYRLYETADLIKVRRIIYKNMLLDDHLGFAHLGLKDRTSLIQIDRELRRRKRHAPATPGDNA